MTQEEMDAQVARVSRDAEEHLHRLMLSLERDATLLGELAGRMARQKNTAPIDWSGAHDKVMVEAGKSAETIDLTAYRAVLDVEALHTLQTEIAAARARLFALREQQLQHRKEARLSSPSTSAAATTSSPSSTTPLPRSTSRAASR